MSADRSLVLLGLARAPRKRNGPQVRRLHWGCGKVRPAGWVNSDIGHGPGIDASCDIVLDGLPFPDEHFDCICSHHALQQLRVAEMLPALAELQRVLKGGGLLRLGLPDFELAMTIYRERRQERLLLWDWNSIGGNFITQVTDYNYTKTPLTYDFAEELLRRAGFVDVARVEPWQTRGRHPEIVDLDCRPEESFFVEASKPKPGRKHPAGGADNLICGIHLSWADDPARTLTATWSTKAEQGGARLEWQRVGAGGCWGSIGADTQAIPGGGFIQRVTLTGLEPSTVYEYRIVRRRARRTTASKVYRTRTAPPAGPADFSFGFICDTGISGRPDGNASGTAQVIRALAAKRPLLVLGGGDYAYADRDKRFPNVADAVDAWFEQMQPLLARVPLMAQYGNHEVFLGERFRDWALRFAHPGDVDDGRNYSFRVGDAHFTALYVPGPEIGPEQVIWLDADLTKAREQGARWLIVYHHEPIFGHGQSHPADPRVRAALAPVFEKHRVDLHLSGHDQNYERTHPLVGVPRRPIVASRGSNIYEAGQGVIYAKVSPGGKKSDKGNDFSRCVAAPPDFIAARDDAAHHYALTTVRGRGEILVNVYGLVGDGTPEYLLDSFGIVAAAGNRWRR